MPLESKSQNRLMHWADEHPDEAAARGLKPSVAREFIKAGKGQDISKLPERVAKKATGGRVGPPITRW